MRTSPTTCVSRVVLTHTVKWRTSRGSLGRRRRRTARCSSKTRRWSSVHSGSSRRRRRSLWRSSSNNSRCGSSSRCNSSDSSSSRKISSRLCTTHKPHSKLSSRTATQHQHQPTHTHHQEEDSRRSTACLTSASATTVARSELQSGGNETAAALRAHKPLPQLLVPTREQRPSTSTAQFHSSPAAPQHRRTRCWWRWQPATECGEL